MENIECKLTYDDFMTGTSYIFSVINAYNFIKQSQYNF